MTSTPTQHEHASPTQNQSANISNAFVIDGAPTGLGEQTKNGSNFYVPTTDAVHYTALLEHLSTDLGNLLNRTDISDCYLNVKGTFMAVHKCILAARSNAFAGK